MDDRLEFVTLPLDTPDDDPRWAGWRAQMDLGFLDPGAGKDVARYRADARAEGWRIRGLLDPAALLADTPVATFVSSDKPVNVGSDALVTGNLISDVTVRATHRRRGVLTRLMTDDLREARERGCALALLTASEGSIYGRFGFGVGSRWAKGEIDTTKWQLRRPAEGACDFIRPADAGEYHDRLGADVLRTDRGAFGRWPHHRAIATGEWSFEQRGPNEKLFAVVHRDEAGVVDGVATYEPVADSDPGRIVIKQLIGRTPLVETALFDFLASLDLVERVGYGRFRLDDPVQAALVNPRAIKLTGVSDLLWVRMLDAEQALAARGFDADGDLALRVVDPMGLVDGTYALSVRDGRATVEQTTREPQATVDAETFGQLFYAGVAPSSLAAAGRIDGDAAAVVRLFSVLTAPWSAVGF